MSGFETVMFVDRVRDHAARLGFRLCAPAHHFVEHDRVALRPIDSDTLPVYSRDAELFTGTLEQLEQFLNGIEWARNYDRILRVSDDTKRKRKEQDCRNQNLARLLKHGPVQTQKPNRGPL